jgi:parallel beta-helix repeat protein
LAARHPAVVRFRPRVERLECRRVPATLLVSQTGDLGGTPTPFSTIQSAVDASSPGDAILVGPGLYEEQVLITKDNLTLQAAVPLQAAIEAITYDVMQGNAAIVDIQGAHNVTINAFTIMGPGPDAIPTGSINFGVYVEGGGSATIENNHITQITDNPLSNNPSGVGIEVGLSPSGASALGPQNTNGQLLPTSTGSATIVNNFVDTYQEAGIVVDNAGSSATIQSNIVAAGPVNFEATTGIQVSNGAVGVVQGNSVLGNRFVANRYAEAAGIRVSNPGSGVQVLNNSLAFNDAGIVVEGALNPVISGNAVVASTLDGIQLRLGTSGAQVTSNVSDSNGLNGIFVYFSASNNTLANNTTASNSQDGIELMQVTGNLLQGNTSFQNSRYGISLFLSANQFNTLSDNNAYGNLRGDFYP